MSSTIAKMEVWPVAGCGCMELNLSGIHAPYPTRSVVVLYGDSGGTGAGEVLRGQKITKVLEECIPLVVGIKVAEYKSTLLEVKKHPEEEGEEDMRGNQTFDLRTDAHVVTITEASCLDLLGKYLEVPVCKLLGERQQRGKVRMLGYLFSVGDRNKTGLPYLSESDSDHEWYRTHYKGAPTAESVAALTKAAKEKYGSEDFRLKSDVLPENGEMDIVRAPKKEFLHARIDLDSNGRRLLGQAVRYVEGMQGILTYCEDLCGVEGVYSGREITSKFRRHMGFPTATNMIATDWREAGHPLEPQVVDIILADPCFWTMTGSVRMGQMRHDFGYTWGSHSDNHFNIPLAVLTRVGAAVPGEYNALDTHWIWQGGLECLIKELLQIMDGYVAVPKKPDFGVEVDMDQIKKTNQLYLENRPGTRNDAMGTQYLIPGQRFDPKRPCLVRQIDI